MDRLNITHQAKRKGFSLIEAAIVLGVVGAVLGGIWSAASAIHRKMLVNELSTTTISALSCIQRKFPNIPLAAAVASWQEYTRAIFFGGCFPETYKLNIKNATGGNDYGYIYAPFYNKKQPHYGVFYVYPFDAGDGIAWPNFRIQVSGSECGEFLFKTIKKAGNNLAFYGINNVIYHDKETVDIGTLNVRCGDKSNAARIELTFRPK